MTVQNLFTTISSKTCIEHVHNLSPAVPSMLTCIIFLYIAQLSCKRKPHNSMASVMRVPGLPIRDCARGCNNCAQMCTQLSANVLTGKKFFARLYLVPGLRKIALCHSCPCAPTTPTIYCMTISRFLCNFFPRMAPHFFCPYDSPSNLAESRYTLRDQFVDTHVTTFANECGKYQTIIIRHRIKSPRFILRVIPPVSS